MTKKQSICILNKADEKYLYFGTGIKADLDVVEKEQALAKAARQPSHSLADWSAQQPDLSSAAKLRA